MQFAAGGFCGETVLGADEALEMLDIVQEGNCGLAHGVKKFDPERVMRYRPMCTGGFGKSPRYLSCSDRVIRLPSHAVELLSKENGRRFFEEHGRPPTLMSALRIARSARQDAAVHGQRQ